MTSFWRDAQVFQKCSSAEQNFARLVSSHGSSSRKTTRFVPAPRSLWRFQEPFELCECLPPRAGRPRRSAEADGLAQCLGEVLELLGQRGIVQTRQLETDGVSEELPDEERLPHAATTVNRDKLGLRLTSALCPRRLSPMRDR